MGSCMGGGRPGWIRGDEHTAAKWPQTSSEELRHWQERLQKVGNCGPRDQGPDAKLIEIYGPKREVVWEHAKDVSLYVRFTQSLEDALPKHSSLSGDIRSDLLRRIEERLPALSGAQPGERVFFCAFAMGKETMYTKAGSIEVGGYRNESYLKSEIMVGDSMPHRDVDDAVLLMRAAWTAAGNVWRHKGHDGERGFENFGLALRPRAHQILEDAMFFSLPAMPAVFTASPGQ
mmetsp:Transcript_5742/g.13239  ORF Transcript_5742/g.13239 Transcript_5742/m.13239 type:complete len:232 (-) Transcript_5742:260-955(-)